MNNNSYKLKYYKYKNKYLELKEKIFITQEGGIFPAQTGTIGFFIDIRSDLWGSTRLRVDATNKKIYGEFNKLLDLSYDQLCNLSCAVVKQDQSVKEWTFPIVKRGYHNFDETVKYKRISDFKAALDNEDKVKETLVEVQKCLDDLNNELSKIQKNVNYPNKYKRDNLGYINRNIVYCIVCKINYGKSNEIIAIYRYEPPKT
jgi:hypothetical protein